MSIRLICLQDLLLPRMNSSTCLHLTFPLSCFAMAWIRPDSLRGLICLLFGLPRLRRSVMACSDHQRPSHLCATRRPNGSCAGEKSSVRWKISPKAIAKRRSTLPRSRRVGTRPNGKPSGRRDCPRTLRLVPEKTLLQLGPMQLALPPLVSIRCIFLAC